MSADAPVRPSSPAPATHRRGRRRHRRGPLLRWLQGRGRYAALYFVGILFAAYATYWLVQLLDQAAVNETEP